MKDPKGESVWRRLSWIVLPVSATLVGATLPSASWNASMNLAFACLIALATAYYVMGHGAPALSSLARARVRIAGSPHPVPAPESDPAAAAAYASARGL
jgi:hypothetical protein